VTTDPAAVRRAEVKLKAQGWKRMSFWLSPEAVAALETLMRRNQQDGRVVIEELILAAIKGNNDDTRTQQ